MAQLAVFKLIYLGLILALHKNIGIQCCESLTLLVICLIVFLTVLCLYILLLLSYRSVCVPYNLDFIIIAKICYWHGRTGCSIFTGHVHSQKILIIMSNKIF